MINITKYLAIKKDDKMEINYDKKADALYIEIRKGEFSENKKIDDFTIIDLDKDGNILGIEFLEVSKMSEISCPAITD